jgi:riboflavin kinase/FMN adenylyltransferase
MNVLREPSEAAAGGRSVCIAIGMFDGVHLGHQRVIGHAVADAVAHGAMSVAATFRRHPSTVVAPHQAPLLLYPLHYRLRCIEALGVDASWLMDFDEGFSRLTAEAFVRLLAAGFGKLRSVSVGEEFVFGYRRSGDVESLRRFARELGYAVRAIAPVQLDELLVSSTRIREAVAAGDLGGAARLLGRPYELAGPVVPGDGWGRGLGFPTANLDTGGLVVPPNGVYTATAQVEAQTFLAVVNIGRRPTVAPGGSEGRVEAHLLDFYGDLYERELALRLGRRLREERRFESVEALRRQIAGDVAAARESQPV